MQRFLVIASPLFFALFCSAFCDAQDLDEKLYSVGHQSLLKAVLSKEIRERVGISDEQWKTFSDVNSLWLQFELEHFKRHHERTAQLIKSAAPDKNNPKAIAEFQVKMDEFRKDRDQEYSDTKQQISESVFGSLLPHQKKLLRQLTFKQHFQSGEKMSQTLWRVYGSYLKMNDEQKRQLKKLTNKTVAAQREALIEFDSLRDKRIVASLSAEQKKLYRSLSNGSANKVLSGDELPRILKTDNSRIYSWVKSSEGREDLRLSETQQELIDKFARHLSTYREAKSMAPHYRSEEIENETDRRYQQEKIQNAIQQHKANLEEVWSSLLGFQRCKIWQADFQYFVETYGLFNTLSIYYRTEFNLSKEEIAKTNQVGLKTNFEFKEAIYDSLEVDLNESLAILTEAQRDKVKQLRQLVKKQKPGSDARLSIDATRSEKRRPAKNLQGKLF